MFAETMLAFETINYLVALNFTASERAGVGVLLALQFDFSIAEESRDLFQ